MRDRHNNLSWQEIIRRTKVVKGHSRKSRNQQSSYYYEEINFLRILKFLL